MTEEENNLPKGYKTYTATNIGAGATVIMGEHITNIQNALPKTADGEFLAQQFAELIKEIGAKPDTEMDKFSKKVAMKKTEKVAEGLAKAGEKPEDLAEAVTDAKTYENKGKLNWIWNKTKEILTSDAAKKTIEKIADKAIQTVVKSMIGGA